MKTLEELNVEVRELFNKYHTENFKPNKGLIAEEIGMSRVTFQQFTTDKAKLGYRGLRKIVNFLEKQGYKLKEKV